MKQILYDTANQPMVNRLSIPKEEEKKAYVRTIGLVNNNYSPVQLNLILFTKYLKAEYVQRRV